MWFQLAALYGSDRLLTKWQLSVDTQLKNMHSWNAAALQFERNV